MQPETVWKFSGIQVSAEELELIVETIKDLGGLSRTELAHTVCELLEWKRPNGGLKAIECRPFLEELDAKGLIKLPELKVGGPKKKRPRKIAPDPPEQMPALIETKLGDAKPIEMELVETPEQRSLWREWVSKYHYLGCTVPFGAHLRYFVRVTHPESQRVGCVQFSSPAWRMAPRDHWIGWDDEQRVKRLQWIVQNSRFMILPWVRIHCLASAILAQMAKTIAADWEARYAIRPVLMETLVDRAKFEGTCYRAANWIPLGQTTGRGRMDRKNLRIGTGAVPKEILIYPLCRNPRKKLLEP